jgi:hypothetical protein
MEHPSSATSTSTRSSPHAANVGRSTSPSSFAGARLSFTEGSMSGDSGVDIVAKAAGQTSPSTPRNQAPGILDRRRTQRPNSARQGSGDSVRRGKKAKGLGLNLPVKASPVLSSSPTATPTMADVRSRMRTLDDDLESSVCPIVVLNGNGLECQLIE